MPDRILDEIASLRRRLDAMLGDRVLRPLGANDPEVERLLLRLDKLICIEMRRRMQVEAGVE